MAALFSKAGAAWLRVWPIALAAVPVAVAAVLLELLGPLTDPLTRTEIQLFQKAIGNHAFLPGTLSLIAVLLIHVCIGGAAIRFAVKLTPKPETRGRALFTGSVAGLLLIGVLLVFSVYRWPIYELSYFNFYDLYRTEVETAVKKALLEPRRLWLTPLAISVLLPVGIGIVALALMVAVANDQLRWVGNAPKPTPGSPDAAERIREHLQKLLDAGGGLKRCFYLLSLGLVTSTVAASIFFHLPTKLPRAELVGSPSAINFDYRQLGRGEAEALMRSEAGAAAAAVAKGATPPSPTLDPGFKGAQLAVEKIELAGKFRDLQEAELANLNRKLAEYAAELSTFWGAVFSLTLFLSIGLPLLRLQDEIRDQLASLQGTDRSEARERFSDAGLLGQGGLETTKLLVALVAPLATGPIANFVQVSVAP